MTLPLLEGLDGVRKMSKSYGNHVGVSDAPADMFGKIMSLPDALMESYYQLLTDLMDIDGLGAGKFEKCFGVEANLGSTESPDGVEVVDGCVKVEWTQGEFLLDGRSVGRSSA